MSVTIEHSSLYVLRLPPPVEPAGASPSFFLASSLSSTLIVPSWNTCVSASSLTRRLRWLSPDSTPMRDPRSSFR